MMILSAAGALTRARGFQFSDDGVNGACVARDGFGNWTAAERAIALAIFRKIHFWNGNVFALDVAPNVNLGPIQQRLHPHVLAIGGRSSKLPPEFWGLILVVPFELRVTL